MKPLRPFKRFNQWDPIVSVLVPRTAIPLFDAELVEILDLDEMDAADGMIELADARARVAIQNDSGAIYRVIGTFMLNDFLDIHKWFLDNGFTETRPPSGAATSVRLNRVYARKR